MTTLARGIGHEPHPATGEDARIVGVDALRGFALFGILVVNIAYFASGYPFQGLPDPAFSSWLDRGVHGAVTLLFEMKAYLIFSFLFGYSFTLQLDAAERRGALFRPRILRRLAGLLVLGGLHAVLLFQGDILGTYAILGLILLAVHRIRPRTALIAAGVLLGVVVLLIASLALAGVTPLDEPAALAAGERHTAALAGGPGSVIAEHVRSLPRMFTALVLLQAPVAMAMFLVGLAVGRRRLLADVPAHDRALRRIQWIGLPVGLAGAATMIALGGPADLWGLALATLTGPALAAGYAAGLLRLAETARGRRIAAALAPAGRMALTNYLGQSLACAFVFTGLGLGLIGTIAPAGTMLIALVIFAGQLLLSGWWLARYRYGPAEWLLRAITNAEWPAWRRSPTAPF